MFPAAHDLLVCFARTYKEKSTVSSALRSSSIYRAYGSVRRRPRQVKSPVPPPSGIEIEREKGVWTGSDTSQIDYCVEPEILKRCVACHLEQLLGGGDYIGDRSIDRPAKQ